jgi:putative salt-induced outer membrane protein
MPLRRFVLIVPLTCLLGLPSAPTLAQTAPAPDPPPPLREGTAELSFVQTSGNTDTQSLGIGGEVVYRPRPWEFKWKAGFIRNETDGELSARSFAFLFRSDLLLTERLSAFGQYDYLRDTFSGIEHRNTLAGGLSYLLVNQSPHHLRVDGGLGYTNEQRAAADDLSTAIALAGLAYKLELSDNAEVTDDVRFDLSLSDGDDWRFSNVVALSAKLTTIFSLKLSNTLRFVNAPAVGFDTTDTITAVALVAKF